MSKRGPQLLDFDLNLAPIIDCFTVLITFMLASASFLSISVFDAGFTPVEAKSDPHPPPITVSVNVKEKNEGYQLLIKGSENSTQKYSTPEEIGIALKSLKEKYPSVDSVTLTGDDSVEYEDMVKAMEKIRPNFSGLVLGGF